MCGIAGNFSVIAGDPRKELENVKAMIRLLRHRGPDGEGFWWDELGQIVFGHCRLAIVDLTPAGHQPMISSCKRYVIALNGEIYNFVELKQELDSLGVRFRGHSDTEVLIEGISQWGLRKTLDRVIGMFAFALWDNDEKKLFLVRDRTGKKPLYYVKRLGLLRFASELKALTGLNDMNFGLNSNSIYHYLTFGYIPTPETVYEGIFKIPAGCYLVADQKLALKIQSYWEVKWGWKKEIKFHDAVCEAESLLREAVKIRLRADVPVGCFLSGGIDSGLLTALASIQLDKPLNTFTISFQEGAFDESPLANHVAERYSTNHHIITLSPDLKEVLPKVVHAYDEPFADPSVIPSYCISQEARKYLKVVLNGEGGDELFGGYRRHMAIKLYSQLIRFLGALPEGLYRKLSEIIPQPKSFRSEYAFIHRFIRGVVKDPYERYIAWCVDGFNEVEKGSLYKAINNGVFSSVKSLSDRFQNMAHLHPLDHFMVIDLLFNMHNDMLIKMDIATMSHGLEGRNPFLDHRIIEWAFSLSPDVRLKGFKTKPILRELSKRYLPEAIVNAPKRGFEIPLIEWLRKDLFEMVYDTCLSSNRIVLELFNRKYVENLIFGKQRLDPDRWSKRVWILFILALWGELNK